MSSDFVTNEEVVQAARRKLTQDAWDYLVGGSESETSMRRNRLAFDRLAFRPRVLVNVSTIDPSTTFLGHKMRIPVMLAPVGGLHRFTPLGAVAATKAAAQFGTIHVVSSVTEPSLEETAAAASEPKVFQLYVRGDWAWIEDIIGRVKRAGYAALCLTVDTALPSRRERPMLNRSAPAARGGGRNPSFQAALTWESMARIKEMAGLPFMLKGVATAEDAALAIEHGVDVIWVSNHGGRQLDHGLGTLDVLPEITEAVAGKADVVLDGGVQRGTDVLKAVALGASAVAIGKLQGWGLAAAGPEGLVRVLEILEDELVSAMGLLGVTTIDQLTPAYVRRAEAVTPPHEMSAWVNMPVGRIP
ncbi:MAG: alpha-hydroxy-acid oxidizing protein [Chloroflexi bacterium]|nr:alpha-hydroxy-acid oxidizing protein [Chloroflexota bacterium]